MEIIPSIDLQGGRCVRLLRGDFGEATVYSEDPPAVARQFAEAGARRLHVVDLDASRDASVTNREKVEAILAWGGLAVQVAGGIRRVEDAERWLDLGAAFVVLGTIVLEDFSSANEIAQRWPERALVALDVKAGRLATHGWLQVPGPGVDDLLGVVATLPLAGLIYTSIERDGTMEGPDLDGLRRLISEAALPVYASGGITTMAHLEELARIGAAGAILGRALYEKRLDLKAALAGFSLPPGGGG